MSAGDLCHEEVTRKGFLEPCEKQAVALRLDEAGQKYPVCVRHARAPMVSLPEISKVLDSWENEWVRR